MLVGLDLAADRFRHAVAKPHQLLELGEIQRLVSVAQGIFRIGMDLDDQAVGAGGNGRGRHPRDQVAVARAVTRIDQHRQMRPLVQIGNRGQGEREAGVGLEGADAASQSITWGLPALRMYSAASSSSSMVAL